MTVFPSSLLHWPLILWYCKITIIVKKKPITKITPIYIFFFVFDIQQGFRARLSVKIRPWYLLVYWYVAVWQKHQLNWSITILLKGKHSCTLSFRTISRVMWLLLSVEVQIKTFTLISFNNKRNSIFSQKSKFWKCIIDMKFIAFFGHEKYYISTSVVIWWRVSIYFI